jgi:hypothetical protein
LLELARQYRYLSSLIALHASMTNTWPSIQKKTCTENCNAPQLQHRLSPKVFTDTFATTP